MLREDPSQSCLSSHDWHVQPVVKDPYSPPPKRCRLDRGPRPKSQVSSNLCADCHSPKRLIVVSASASLPFLYLPVNSFVFTLISSRSSSLIAVATRRVKTPDDRWIGFL